MSQIDRLLRKAAKSKKSPHWCVDHQKWETEKHDTVEPFKNWVEKQTSSYSQGGKVRTTLKLMKAGIDRGRREQDKVHREVSPHATNLGYPTTEGEYAHLSNEPRSNIDDMQTTPEQQRQLEEVRVPARSSSNIPQRGLTDEEKYQAQWITQGKKPIMNALLKLMKQGEEGNGEGTGWKDRHGEKPTEGPDPYSPDHPDEEWLRNIRRQPPEGTTANYQQQFGGHPEIDADDLMSYDDQAPYRGDASGGSTARHEGTGTADTRTPQEHLDQEPQSEEEQVYREAMRRLFEAQGVDLPENDLFLDPDYYPPEVWRTKEMGRTDLDPSMQEAIRRHSQSGGGKGPGSGVQNSIEKALLKLMKQGEEDEFKIPKPIQPSDKSPQMDQDLKDVFGVDRRQSIKSGACTMCKGEADKFRDDLSRKEYGISGMCQDCQDNIFGGAE